MSIEIGQRVYVSLGLDDAEGVVQRIFDYGEGLRVEVRVPLVGPDDDGYDADIVTRPIDQVTPRSRTSYGRQRSQ